MPGGGFMPPRLRSASAERPGGSATRLPGRRKISSPQKWDVCAIDSAQIVVFNHLYRPQVSYCRLKLKKIAIVHAAITMYSPKRRIVKFYE